MVAGEARERKHTRLQRGNRPPVGENCPHGKTGRTRDLMAAYLGDTKGRTLEQAVAVFDSTRTT